MSERARLEDEITITVSARALQAAVLALKDICSMHHEHARRLNGVRSEDMRKIADEADAYAEAIQKAVQEATRPAEGATKH